MHTHQPLSFSELKTSLKIPTDRVLGSTTDLPAKVLGLFYLESRASHLSRMTSLNCYVPKFICIRTGEKLGEHFPPLAVCEANLTTLQKPFHTNSDAQRILRQSLTDGYSAACSHIPAGSEVIIRSAGKYEDGQIHCYAGVYKSLRMQSFGQQDDFIKTGMRVVMSPYAPAALRYHYFNSTPIQPIDIIVQEFVKNSLALNFTVTPQCIESIEILGLHSAAVFIPGKYGRPGTLIERASGTERDDLPKLREVMDHLHHNVDRAFRAEATGNTRISIECTLDRSHIHDSTYPKNLALLQIRPLPSPVENRSGLECLDPSSVHTEALLPIHTHLIGGPCVFDSVIVCQEKAIASYDVALELVAVTTRLRERNLSLPIIILEEHITGLSCLAAPRILNTLANLPAVGVIDQGRHISRWYGDNEATIFAGHVGAVWSERLRLLGNAYSFMDNLSEHAQLQELQQQIVPTEFERLLASDLAEEPYSDGPLYRCTQVFLPEAPMSLEVVENPDDESSNPWDAGDDSSKLRLTGALKPWIRGRPEENSD